MTKQQLSEDRMHDVNEKNNLTAKRAQEIQASANT